MLGGRIDPARALQLINIAEPLHPRRIDQSFLSDLALCLRHRKQNITMDRVGDQRRALRIRYRLLGASFVLRRVVCHLQSC